MKKDNTIRGWHKCQESSRNIYEMNKVMGLEYVKKICLRFLYHKSK